MKELTEPTDRKNLLIALETIMASAEAKALKWAIGYTRFCIDLIKANASTLAIRNQLLYVQCNIQYWRHPRAKEVRNVIKEFVKATADLY